MNTIHKLTQLFTRFPGIGPRQAGRFVYFLLASPQSYRNELVELIRTLKEETKVCPSCMRFHSGQGELCTVCADSSRDASSLMLVEKDVDLDNIERTGSYTGRYFVIGGTVPILDKTPERSIREKELLEVVKERTGEGLKEIILAFSVNAEGENTVNHVRRLLTPLLQQHKIRLSTLGRGLSTGSELEYSDSETIKSALKNRA
ncbi:MAG: toprim domain-containing protein [Candidatus Pacebacteria bacterium]|nr:toprim domain-containing protein [Candidatus Paceibacterota bacterium]